MTQSFNNFRLFLGQRRFNALLVLLLSTGLVSTFFVFVRQSWAVTAQTLAFLVFLIGAVGIVVSAMEGDQRYRWGAILFPVVIALLFGVLIAPHLLGFAVGASVGWIIAGTLIFGRSREPLEYKRAVKAMRKGNFDEAIQAMDSIIRDEPNTAHHFRFRAELLRLAGKLPRAKTDYERMKNLAKTDAEKAIAYNGLAEVELQAKQYTNAQKYALSACELAPHDWVTAYNLAMIQDRLKDSAGVIESLTKRLSIKEVPDARHRLLMYLYLGRAYARTQDADASAAMVTQLKKDRGGLKEWEMLLAEQNAGVLREVLAADVAAVRQLIDGQMSAEVWA